MLSSEVCHKKEGTSKKSSKFGVNDIIRNEEKKRLRDIIPECIECHVATDILYMKQRRGLCENCFKKDKERKKETFQ